MVYVDTAPGKGALDPDFDDAEKPMVWKEIEEEENLDGISEEQKERSASAPCRCPAASSCASVELTNDARRDIPSTLICTGVHRRAVPDLREGASRVGVPGRDPRAAERDLGRPADQPLADVVAAGRARADHRRRRDGPRLRPMTDRRRDQPARVPRGRWAPRTGECWPTGACAFFRDRLVRGERQARRRHRRAGWRRGRIRPTSTSGSDGVTVRLDHGRRRLVRAEPPRRRARPAHLRAGTRARHLPPIRPRSRASSIIPGAPDTAAVMPFWRAVLGYEPRARQSRRGPRRPADAADRPSGSSRWTSRVPTAEARSTSPSGCRRSRPRPGSRPRWPPAAAWCATGSRPSWWTLADAAGNEADIATVTGRD